MRRRPLCCAGLRQAADMRCLPRVSCGISREPHWSPPPRYLRQADVARGSILDFRVLVLPGLYGSGPEHWQSRWQRLYPFFERVEQAQWDVPDLDAWSERLDESLRTAALPTLIVAHSFGCLTTVHRAAQSASS